MRLTRNNLALLAAFVVGLRLQAAEADPAKYVLRKFQIDAVMVSYIPGEGIESFKNHGAGMSTDQASLGLGVDVDTNSISVRIVPRVKNKRFIVTLDAEPEAVKRSLGFEKQTLDLTDLKPTSIRLAIGKNGRVYQLNLTPTVQVTDNTPQRLDVSKLQLQNWRFPDSPILVNDAIYVGRISCAQSPVAMVDISGVALVEFSLYELTNSKPWGDLNHGIVTLTNPEDHTTIQISNVSNGGPAAVELPGGPYRVWVRWSKPTYTVEQYRQVLEELRKKILDGEIPNASTDYLDKQLARDPSPWVSSNGIRGLRRGERADEVKGKTKDSKTGAVSRSSDVIDTASTPEK
jgi:hypothetical protein